mgnify:FL=1
MKVIYIEWMDATASAGVLRHKQPAEFGLLLVATAGIYMGETDEVIKISQDWWADTDDGSDVHQSPYAIPKVLIKKRLEWEVPDKEPRSGSGLARQSIQLSGYAMPIAEVKRVAEVKWTAAG